MQIVVNGLLTHYDRSGTGKPVVLLHGWGDSSRTFNDLMSRLAKRYQVFAINLPGFGGSQAPPSAWDVTDYAKFTADAFAKLGIQPYAIVGHSNGGAIAIRGIARSLFPTTKLVLLASAGVRGEDRAKRRVIQLLVKGGKVVTRPLPASLRRRLRTKAYTSVGSDLLVNENLSDTFKKVVRDDVRTDAAAVRVPTLLIYGEDDAATPVRYGHIFNDAIQSSELKTLKGAGHFVHQDEPAEVARLIEDFLQ